MTIFALTDAAVASVGSRLTTDALGQHVIQGFPGFSPDFIVGQVYDTASRGKIKVTIAGDDYLVNGVKIVKVNAIMTNGVVHYVEDVSFLRLGRRRLSRMSKLKIGRSLAPTPARSRLHLRPRQALALHIASREGRR